MRKRPTIKIELHPDHGVCLTCGDELWADEDREMDIEIIEHHARVIHALTNDDSILFVSRGKQN